MTEKDLIGTYKADAFSSCEVQFLTCRESAEALGQPIQHWIGQRFDDEGFSGATLDRPAMRKLRKVIDLGGIDRLYAVALDRLTRSMRDAVLLLDEFERAGVEWRRVLPRLGRRAVRARPVGQRGDVAGDPSAKHFSRLQRLKCFLERNSRIVIKLHKGIIQSIKHYDTTS